MSFQTTLLLHPPAHVETCRLTWALNDKQRAAMVADAEKPERKKKPKPKLFDYDRPKKPDPPPRRFIQGPPSSIIQDGPRESHQSPPRQVTSPQLQLVKAQPAGDEVSVAPWVQAALAQLRDLDLTIPGPPPPDWQVRQQEAELAKASWLVVRRDRKDKESRACLARVLKDNPPHPMLRIIDHRGRRDARADALTEVDLYITNHRPDFIDHPRLHHVCYWCLNAKSHPVILVCGHSACYVCVRLWLETEWDCAQCGELITRPPAPHYDEKVEIEGDYPGWDLSALQYAWDGLKFPRTPLVY
ncbi:hypothetical protein K438DRAFT_1981659 [Mycena galopus ATCC 62051]|nr:hypothetical protein K438DRAFT_1981659 [Mycena galopus ATCC 62051]